MQPSRTIRLLRACLLATPLVLVASPSFARAPVQTVQAAPQPTAVNPPPGVLLAVEGEVSSIRGPRIEPASGGMPFDLRERIETAAGGALIIWNDAIVIAVGDNTSLHVISPHRLHLARGRLVLLVPPPRADQLTTSAASTSILTIENGSTMLDLLQAGEYELHVDGAEGERQTMEVAVRIGRAAIGDAQRHMRIDPRHSAKMRAGGKPRETLYWKKSHVTRFASVLARLRDIREGRPPLSAQYLPEALHGYAWLFDLYGSWFVDQTHGYYWVPRVADAWQPYGSGRWIYRGDYGWVWVDEAEWGWATQHYGRWTMDARGTWAWRPDSQWSGGWVRWETVDEEVVWCPLGWDDYPAYEFPYDRSRERHRGALPRRGWLSARPTREAHHIRPDPPGRWPPTEGPAIERPTRPPTPPAGPRPPVDAPTLANVAVPRDRGTAVPRSGGVAAPRDDGGAAVILSGTAIPRQQPTSSGASLSAVARDAPSAAALHEQGSRTPARSPQRANGSGGSDVTTTGAATSTDTVDRNREAWDRYQAELARQQSRDAQSDSHSSTPARSPQRARSSTPQPDPTPDPTPTPPPVSPSEPEPAPAPPPEPSPASPPEPTPTPTPTPTPAPEPPPPPPQARPRDPDPDPPSRAVPREPPPESPRAETRPDPPSGPPPSSDPPAHAVPRDPDEPQSAPSRRPPDEPASSGPRRRNP